MQRGQQHEGAEGACNSKLLHISGIAQHNSCVCVSADVCAASKQGIAIHPCSHLHHPQQITTKCCVRSCAHRYPPQAPWPHPQCSKRPPAGASARTSCCGTRHTPDTQRRKETSGGNQETSYTREGRTPVHDLPGLLMCISSRLGPGTMKPKLAVYTQ